MKKSYTITIPEPCHEDWGKMTPTEKGKFCDQCAKEVFDFTKTTDEDIVKKLSEGGNLCGRFKNTQLNREMKLERKSKNGLLPYAASFLLPLSLLGHQEAKSQGGASAFHKSAISLNIGSHTSMEKSIVIVSGQITDVDGKPIKNAEAIVLETGERSRSNHNGEYTIKCVSGSTLFFLKNDMRSTEYTLGNKDAIINVLLKQEFQNVILKQKLQTVSVVAGGIRAVPIDAIDKAKPEVDLVEILRNKAAACGLEQESDSKIEDTINKITISGTITDEYNLPFPGVNVIVEGTAIGTQTDFDGNYSIEVDPNQALVFSYLGYLTKEVRIANVSNQFIFSMKPDFDMLQGEIVITGGLIAIKEDQIYSDPYARESYLDVEQWQNRKDRQESAVKENAFKKIKMIREKAARKLKRASKRKK